MDDPSAPPVPPGPPDQPVTAPSGSALPPEDQPPGRDRPPVPRGLLWALALAVVVLTIASWMALSDPRANDAGGDGHAGHLPTTDLTGQPAPDAAYTMLDGEATNLAALRGEPVVLNFWSASCVPCITEMPAFEQVHQAYGEKVKFVGLATADNETTARAQQRRTGVTYPLGFDPEGQIARKLGIITIPATVLIDRNGTIVHVAQGPALTQLALTSIIADKLRP